MARIPEAELARPKAEISLERLAESQGIRLAVHGVDRIGLCPFHDDREPSLVITPAKNRWHCLGACQAGGSVIDRVMRAEGVSFRHAVQLLLADVQSGIPSLLAPQQPISIILLKYQLLIFYTCVRSRTRVCSPRTVMKPVPWKHRGRESGRLAPRDLRPAT